MTRAARYRRVSGVTQEDNTSLENQLNNINKYCLEHEYDISDDTLYTDIMTGIDWRNREALQKALAETDKYDVLVADDPDRIARGEPLIIIMSELTYKGKKLETVKQVIDDTEEGKVVLYFLSYASKREWKRTRQRVTEGKQNFVEQQHRILGSIPAYGYKWENPAPKKKGTYIINDEIFYTEPDGTEWSERLVVIFIFDLAKQGATVGRIAKILTQKGIPTRKGHTYWHESTVSRILRNPTYIGMFYGFRENYVRNGKGYKRERKDVEDMVLYPIGTVPAIIDEETFKIVRAQIDHNKEVASRNNKHPEAALMRAGLAICGHCLFHMNSHHEHDDEGNIHHTQYYCPRSTRRSGACNDGAVTISAKKVDDEAWAEACRIIRDPSKLKEKIKGMRTPDPSLDHGVSIETRKKELEEEILEYMDSLHTSKTKTARDRAKAWIKKLEEDLIEITQEEKIISGVRNHWQSAQNEILRFEAWCESWREKLEKATYADKRTCIEYLGIRAVIYRFGHRPRVTLTVGPPKILEKLSSLDGKTHIETTHLALLLDARCK